MGLNFGDSRLQWETVAANLFLRSQNERRYDYDCYQPGEKILVHNCRLLLGGSIDRLRFARHLKYFTMFFHIVNISSKIFGGIFFGDDIIDG